ncbi:hypothetical protein SAMN04487783_0036 [Agrococcus baldri]|uniref:Uncharacterized protein n=1 Tax=Agrococcus baldri TaxID=153730 RepID=A0AA94KYA4_9MICO|nr:hypothetical protein [Agrococcus baldri]SFR96965.1 hypothetical protein SAMN04487783_0036 [Agrococcus baldri]
MSDADASSADSTADKKARKVRLSQEDVPGFPLDQALRVARSIAENYAFSPTKPLNVAAGMGVTPTSGFFRGVTGAAVAYGLTSGGYNAAEIGLTPLGLRIVRPTTEGDDLAAKREALLKPKIVGDFLRKYDNAALPTDAIAKNVLQERGVPAARLDDVYDLIISGANDLGFLRDLSGKRYVDLSGATVANGSGSDLDTGAEQSPSVTPRLPAVPSALPPTGGAPAVTVSSGVNINIEIHIAADASTQTIDDIFKSMSRYVLRSDGDGDASST